MMLLSSNFDWEDLDMFKPRRNMFNLSSNFDDFGDIVMGY